jgi:hypothetical protein
LIEQIVIKLFFSVEMTGYSTASHKNIIHAASCGKFTLDKSHPVRSCTLFKVANAVTIPAAPVAASVILVSLLSV